MKNIERFLRKCRVHNCHHGISVNMWAGKSINAGPMQGKRDNQPSQ